MKKNSLVRVILTCLAIMLFAGMAMGSSWLGIGDGALSDDEKKDYDEAVVDEFNYKKMMPLTGNCLTYEEMEQKLSEYEKVQMEYSNKQIESESQHILTVPSLQLILPGEHEHDENTRYKISALTNYDPHHNSDAFIEGLEVTVMDDTSGCEIEENTQPQEQTETPSQNNLRIERWKGKFNSITVVFSEDENYITTYPGKLYDNTLNEKWPEIRSEYTRNGNEITYKQWELRITASDKDDDSEKVTWENCTITYLDDNTFVFTNLDHPEDEPITYTRIE